MRPYIELYINEQLVEFNEPPQVLLTYSHNEIHNPTIVKNSYSKTITIDGTPKNKQIFKNFEEMRWINGAGFNPSRKESFILFKNGDPIESGYVKLDNVVKNGKTVQYQITLYGGLGQFFYNLSYGEDGEQRKLRDLVYPYEINMSINKDTIRDAWRYINNTGINQPSILAEGVETAASNIYDFINFAPCYNGVPKDFTANKVAINAEMLPEDFQAQLDLENGDYETVNGWISGELIENLDEWKTKDLRSYLQRPVIRFKEVFNACCNPDNNGGFEVVKDETFFNSENPYWENAWMTLPLLTDIEHIESDAEITTTDDGSGKISLNGLIKGDVFNAEINYYVTSNANVTIQSNGYGRTLVTGVYTFDRDTPLIAANMAIYSQLVAYNADGVAVGGSNVISLTRQYGAIPSNFTYDLEYQAPVTVVKGAFQYMGGIGNVDYRYRFWDDFELGRYVGGDYPTHKLTLDNVTFEDGMYLKFVTKIATLDVGTVKGFAGKLFWTEGYDAFPTEPRLSEKWSEVNPKRVVPEWFVSKDNLLNSEHTPVDYFLSYCKMFNLHLYKDMYNKKIYVETRPTFFKDEVYDIEDYVDRDDNINITPITFDAKWYNFETEMETSGELYKDYMNEYGIKYGIQRIDTNYNFDNSSKNLLEKSIFKSAIMQRGKSRYYVDIYSESYSDTIPMPPYVQDGVKTFLHNSSGDTTEGTYITPKTTNNTAFYGYDKNYDITPKLSFVDNKNEPIDGANVMIFYNGYKELKDENGNYLRFHITDDIPEFEKLNEGEPMWIWTSSSWDAAGNTIAYNVANLPIFGRYITNENGWIVKSWDFGTPKALYVPDYKIDDSSNLYAQYWQNYVRDMYDVNTRVVKCKVWLRERVVGDWLKRFYYFDGSYWIINEIKDYDIGSNKTTECTLIRVNNRNNYL